MISALNTLKARASRYWISTVWVLGDVFASRRGLCLRIMAMIGASLALRFLAFLVLSRYIHLLESTQTREIFFLGEIVPSKSHELLIMAALACLGLFVAGACAKYLAETRLLNLMAEYELECVKRASDAIGRYGGDARMQKWQPDFSKIIGGDSRSCSLVARMAIRLMMPACIVLITIGALFYLDAKLTLVLMVLMAACVPLFYAINIRGVRHSMAVEEKATAAVLAKRQSIEDYADRIRGMKRPEEIRDMALELDEPPVRSAIDAYMRRMRSTEESSLLINVLMGVAVFAILLFKGWEILQSEHSWALIAVYFLVLRFCLGGVMQGANLVTGINRLYHQFSRYRNFMATVAVVSTDVQYAAASKKFWAAPRASGGKPIEELDDELE